MSFFRPRSIQGRQQAASKGFLTSLVGLPWMEVLAPEPSGLSYVEGAEAVVESVATGVEQARHLALQVLAEVGRRRC